MKTYNWNQVLQSIMLSKGRYYVAPQTALVAKLEPPVKRCDNRETQVRKVSIAPKEAMELVDHGDIRCAVEAFVRFGRSDMLEDLTRLYEWHEDIEFLIGSLANFSEAVQLCKADDMEFGLHSIRTALGLCEQITTSKDYEQSFLQLIPNVKIGLEYMLDIYPTSQDLQLAIIQWCLKVGLLQQAITLATEWLPTILFNKKIYYTDRTDMEEQFKEEMENMQRTWKECFVITYRDYAGNKTVSTVEGQTAGAEISRVRDLLRGAQTKDDVTRAFSNFAYNKDIIVPFLHKLYEVCMYIQHNVRTNVDVMYLRRHYPDVEEMLSECYERVSRSESYHKKYYQYLQQISLDYGQFIRPFFDQKIEVLIERYRLYEGVRIIDDAEEGEDLGAQRIKLIRDYQAMLAYGSAKTNCSQLEALQFMVEFHYIRHLRNHINHAADKTLVITKAMVQQSVSTLVSSLEAGKWLGEYTVEAELEAAKA